MTFNKVCVIVLDSVGIGEAADAERYGDQGAHTLGHIAEKAGLSLPNLRSLGLANITSLHGMDAVPNPEAYFGKMAEASIGKDTMTGHWELMGLITETPFQVYPDGFPQALIREFERRTGRSVIGNKPASGTAIIEELGAEQMQSGAWIVYTSADSVFQIAAHEEIIPLDELYQACEIARELTLQEQFRVGRVIARPYVGEPGSFVRTPNRHDYAVKPPAPTLLNHLHHAGIPVIAIGKINDIFSGEGISDSHPTKNNLEGIQQTIAALQSETSCFIFTNLVDFDSLFGHRRDPVGYAKALEQFDQFVPEITGALDDNDLLIITADHGNDPVHHGTDHTREYVPILVYSPRFKQPGGLGTRATFADLAATLADIYGVRDTGNGESFAAMLR